MFFKPQRLIQSLFSNNKPRTNRRRVYSQPAEILEQRRLLSATGVNHDTESTNGTNEGQPPTDVTTPFENAETSDSVNMMTYPFRLDGNGTLQINGTDGGDILTVSGDMVTLETAARTYSHPLKSVQRIEADLNDGNDELVVRDVRPRLVLGYVPRPGHRIVSAISFGVDGGAGDDTLTGGMGDDTLDGGSGNDVLHGGYDFQHIDRDIHRDSPDGGNDVLIGGMGQDSINGGGGDDILLGGGGADTLRGGLGDDVVRGQGGTDLLDEVTEYGGGNVMLNDGQLVRRNAWDGDANWVVTEEDTLQGVELAMLTGSRGSDLIDASDFTGHVTLLGEGGDDSLTGGIGDDQIEGGDGDDLINGNQGNDILSGGQDNDFVQGAAGDDQISGGSGNDTLRGNSGYDVLAEDIRATIDPREEQTQEDSAAPFVGPIPQVAEVIKEVDKYQLTDTGFSGFGDDSINEIEAAQILGTEQHEQIDAREFSGKVTLNGGGGDDELIGTGGVDVLLGGDGDDTIKAGHGDDFIHAGSGDDRIDAGTGNDRAFAGDGDDEIEAGDGDDTLYGGRGSDRLDGGAGFDVMNESNLTNADFVEDRFVHSFTQEAVTFEDRLSGIEAAKLFGSNQNDRLDGSGFKGLASLYGGAGDDVLFGSEQPAGFINSTNRSAILHGGEGQDLVQRANQRDRISSQDQEQDLVVTTQPMRSLLDDNDMVMTEKEAIRDRAKLDQFFSDNILEALGSE